MISQEDYAKAIATEGLKIGAIKLRPNDPFTWASGYRMPIYNDNRMFLADASHRNWIVEGLAHLVRMAEFTHFDDEQYDMKFDIIAGTATAGIPHATGLANKLNLPLVYIREKPKDHGMRNQIEGIDADSNLNGKRVLVVEDLISTGGSSAKAVQAVRDAQGDAQHCFSIFSYGLDEGKKAFSSLNPPCIVRSLLTYDTLLEVAKETGYLKPEDIKLLEEWRADPFNWGANHGFPKVEKK